MRKTFWTKAGEAETNGCNYLHDKGDDGNNERRAGVLFSIIAACHDVVERLRKDSDNETGQDASNLWITTVLNEVDDVATGKESYQRDW